MMFWIVLILSVFPQAKGEVNDLVRRTSQSSENLVLPDMERIGRVNAIRSQNSDGINWLDALEKGDLIVGWPDPHETLYVHDTTWWHSGNVYIVNYGVMLVKDADFRNYGNIFLFNQGKFITDSSKFGFLPTYWWQFGFAGFDTSEIRIENSHFCFSLPILIGDWDNSHLSFMNTQFDAWISAYFFDSAGVMIDNCHGYTGEYCIMDEGTGAITVTNSDTINIWLSFPNGSVADFTTFYEEFVEHWKFPEDVGATGIPYSVTVDSSHFHNTQPMIYSGSDVTIRNSFTHVKIRATGADSLVIYGLMDSTYYVDSVLPLSDRRLRLINTTAEVYAIYTVNSARVWIDSSRVSEIVCTWSSHLNMVNSIHNGRRGAFWVWDSSTADVANSLIQTETVVRGSSKLTLYNSLIEDNIYPWSNGNLIVEDSGIVIILNSRTLHEPKLSEKSVLYYTSVDSPTVVLQVDSVPIYGSAYINGGPDCNISFSSYRLYYTDSLNPDSLIPVGPERADTVRDGLLDYWDTDSLPAGSYTLYLRLKDNFGDSVQTHWLVQVEGSGIEEERLHQEISFSVTPNPFNSVINIIYSIHQLSEIELSIYNLCGQKVAVLDKGFRQKGKYTIKWEAKNFSSGVYFYKLQVGEFSQTKKLLLFPAMSGSR